MEFVQSVSKGYQMLWLLISAMPLPVQAYLSLLFAAFAINFLVAVIKWFLGGGD